ncbi:ABC-three component system middle component 4 [Vibrio cholerae]|uniref:ABC-three component system middle component 4 n=2 Tax=Vibrio cholerae TaxID=666 RepID=UPI0039675F59
MKLPFIEPDEDIYLNISIVMILLYYLSFTNRGTMKMDNERIHIYDYLVRNPQKLTKFLSSLGKDVSFNMNDDYSVSSISYNLDPLFDRERMKYILIILANSNLIEVDYKNKNGFLYSLTEDGKIKVEKLDGEYFSEIKLLSKQLIPTLSLTISQLNISLNKIIRIGNF